MESPKSPKRGGGGRVGEGVLVGILGGGVPLGSPNPEPFSDQEISLLTPKKVLLQAIFIH